MQFHGKKTIEYFIELNITGTLPDEMDEKSQVSILRIVAVGNFSMKSDSVQVHGLHSSNSLLILATMKPAML